MISFQPDTKEYQRHTSLLEKTLTTFLAFGILRILSLTVRSVEQERTPTTGEITDEGCSVGYSL